MSTYHIPEDNWREDLAEAIRIAVQGDTIVVASEEQKEILQNGLKHLRKIKITIVVRPKD